MAILEDGAYCASELLAARGALAKPSADFLFLVLLDLPESRLIGIFAVRANNSIRPADRFQIGTGFVVVSEPTLDFVQGQIRWRGENVFLFHESILPQR
jgi:hypothetical protein